MLSFLLTHWFHPRGHGLHQGFGFRTEVLDTAIGQPATRLTIRILLFHCQMAFKHPHEVPTKTDSVLNRVLGAILTRILVKIENGCPYGILPGQRQMKLVLLFDDGAQRRSLIDENIIATTMGLSKE